MLVLKHVGTLDPPPIVCMASTANGHTFALPVELGVAGSGVVLVFFVYRLAPNKIPVNKHFAAELSPLISAFGAINSSRVVWKVYRSVGRF